jgi:anthranilate phosphoribosyltransferase
LRGGSADENAAIAIKLFDGEQGPVRDTVGLNAGIALVAADIAPDIGEGLARALDAIDSGRARTTLERFREVSQRLKK